MYISIDRSISDSLKGLEVTAYMAIKKFMSFTTYKSRVGIRRIAEEMGVAKNTALKYINQLAEKEVILKKVRFNKEKQEYDTTEYYFIKEMSSKNNAQVVQNSTKRGSAVATKQSLKDMNRNVKEELDVDSLKKELLKDYDENIIDRAFKIVSKTTKRGTVIDNIQAYINKLCSNIKRQDKLVESMNVNNKPTTTNKHKKSPSANNTRASYKTKFHNFEQRTSNYSAKELEDMVLRKK